MSTSASKPTRMVFEQATAAYPETNGEIGVVKIDTPAMQQTGAHMPAGQSF